MAYATTNPYTGETIKTFDTATPEEINQAISSTDAAFREWSQTPIEDRAALLSRAAEILRTNKRDYAETLTLEMGKLIAEAEAEVELSAAILDYYAKFGAQHLAPRYLRAEGFGDQDVALVKDHPAEARIERAPVRLADGRAVPSGWIPGRCANQHLRFP